MVLKKKIPFGFWKKNTQQFEVPTEKGEPFFLFFFFFFFFFFFVFNLFLRLFLCLV